MADRKLQYIIEILPKLGKFDDIKKKLEDGVTLSPKEIQLLKGQLGEAFKGASQEAMALGKEIKKAMSADGVDTSTLVNAVKMIAGAAKELEKSGNPIESWSKIGSSIIKPLGDLETRLNNINNDLSKLKDSSKALNELKSSVESLRTSFAGISSGAGSGTIVSDVGNIAAISTKIDTETKKAYDSVVLLEQKLNSIKDQKITLDISDIKKEINILKQELNNAIDADYDNGTFTRLPIYKKIFALQKQAEKLGSFQISSMIPEYYEADYKDSLKDFGEYATKIKQKYNDAIKNVGKDSSPNALVNQLKDVKLSLRVPPKSEIVNQINSVLKTITSKDLESVKINISDSLNVIGDKTKRSYGNKPAVEDANTTALVNKTKKRFKTIRGAMYEGQNKILKATEKWRKNMLEQLKFKNGDFEFNFGDSLFESLQSYLNEKGNELKFIVDQDTIKEQLKMVIENSGLTIGGIGGTANIDPKTIAQAVYQGMQAAVNGQPVLSFDTNSNSESPKKETESIADIVNSTDKYVKTITEKTINVNRVIDALRDFASASTKKGAGRQKVARWLTDRGIDINAINNGVSDEDILTMLNETLMVKDRFGYAKGSTFADSLSDLKRFGITDGKQKSDVLALKNEIVEMLNRMGVNQEYWQESQRRNQSYESYEMAAKYGRPIAALSNARKPLYANSMKNFVDGGYKRLTDDKYITNLDALSEYVGSLQPEFQSQIQSFRDSILGLGENPAEEAIKALEQVARNFFEQSGKMLQNLFKHYGDKDTFQGRVTLQNGHTIDISSPYNFWGFKDDEVANVDVYSDILMKRWERSKSVKKSVPQDLERPNYYVNRPKVPIDIENERVETQDFSPIDAPKTPDLTNYIKTIESNIQQLSEEKKKTFDELSELDKVIKSKEQEASSISELVNTLTDTERATLTKEAEKAQNQIIAKQSKQAAEQQEIHKINSEIFSTESAINTLAQFDVNSELEEKRNNLIDRINSANSEKAGLNESYIVAYDAYNEAVTKHEEAKKAYEDYIDKLINNALLEEQNSGDIKKLAEEHGISQLEAIDIRKKDLYKKFSHGDTIPEKLQQMVTDVKERVIEEELSKNNIDLKTLRKSSDPNDVYKALRKITGGKVSKITEKQEKAVEEFRRSPEYQKIINEATAKREAIGSLRDQETSTRFNMREKEESYKQVKGRIENFDSIISKFEQERDNLTVEALQAEKDAALQRHKTALSELQYQKKLAEKRLARAQQTEQMASGTLSDNVVLQQKEAERELNELRGRRAKLSGEIESADSSIASNKQKKEKFELQAKYNQLKERELILQREINQLEDGEVKDVKQSELNEARTKLKELETKITALGSSVNNTPQREYTENEKQSDSFSQAVDIQNKLMIAKAQQRAFAKDIQDIEKQEQNVKTGGLTSNEGVKELNKLKFAAAIDFKKSDYYYNVRNREKDNLEEKLDEFVTEQSKAITEKIEEKKNAIRDRVIEKVIGKKQIDLKNIRKSAIDEYVKTDAYQQIKNKATEMRTVKRTEADQKFNQEVNEYVNSLVANEMAKRNIDAEASSRAKDKKISVEDARKSIEQEIRRDVEQQYKEEIRQFTGEANKRRELSYAAAKNEEQKYRSDARQQAGQKAIDKEVAKIAKDKQSEIKRKQDAEIARFESSEEFQTMKDAALNNIRQKQKELWDALDEQMRQLVKEYVAAIKPDKGKVGMTNPKFRSIFSDFIANSGYSLSGPSKVDLKQFILDNLARMKAIAKGESDAGGTYKQEYIKNLPNLISALEQSLDEALSYGGFEYSDLANKDLVEEIINKTANVESNKTKRENKEKDLTKAIDELDQAKKQNLDTKPFKDNVKSIKTEIAALDELIDKEESEVENAKQLIELRAEEKKASTPALSDKLTKAEERLRKSKENLANIKNEIAELEKVAREAESKYGKDSPEAERSRLNLLYKQRTQATLERNIGWDEKRVSRWSTKVGTTETGVPTDTGTTTSSQGGIFSGVISEMKAIASSMSGTIDIDNSDISTETTLRAIFELLSGGGQASVDLDMQKALLKEERDARRKEEQARAIAESKKKIETDTTKEEPKKQSKSTQAKAKLSVEGQAKFNAIQTEGRKAYSELVDSDEKTIISKIKEKAQQLKSLTQGTEEYLKAQYELSNMVFAYTSKLQASGVTSKTKKNGQKYLDYKDVLERPEIKKLGDIKSLMLPSKNDIADGLVKLGFGAKLSSNKKDQSQSMESITTSNGIVITRADFDKAVQRMHDDSFRTTKIDPSVADALFKHLSEKSIRSDYNNLQERHKTGTLSNTIALMMDGRDFVDKKLFLTPEIVPGAIDKEVKENVTKTPAEAPVIPTVRETDYQKAVETVRGAIGDFSLRTSNVNKAEKYNSLGQEVKDAANVLRTTKEGVTKEGNDLLNKMRKLRDAANKVAQKETKTTDQTTVTEEMSNEDAEMETKAFQEGLGRVLSRAQDMADRIATLENEKASLSAPQGGIIGAINNLAKESTLGKVLTALGEIAKKNAMASSGKANSAQDLLEQFRRMLESDAWEGRERVAYIDLNTGTMSNQITGDNKEITADRLGILRAAYKDVMDLNAQVHTHANKEDPYFSADDFKQFGTDFTNGITKQILLSKNNMTVLDMTDVKNVDGLLQALAKTDQNFEALAATANKFGAKYISKAFNEITPQGLVKMLGIKGIESKLNETETRDSAVQGVLQEDAKVAADMLQESTGRSVKKTVERVGAELMTTTEKIDAKGNKTWSKQINDKYTKAALATNKAFKSLELEKEFGVGTDAQLALVDYQNKYEEFLRLTEKFKKNPNQNNLQAQFDKLLPELDAAEEKLNKLIISKDKFLNGKEPIKIFEGADLANAGDSLKGLATSIYAQNGLNPGDNIAFNGISETPNGTRLLVDILKDGTIQQYALEVDRATGQVKEFMLAETALANAFQNVNKAMRLNETVKANVAVGDDPIQQQNFLNDASSPLWNNYKKAMSDMETYVANIWNRMANGGRGASQKELDYVMALSEKVIQLGRAVQKTSTDFKTFWADNPEYVSQANIKTRTKSGRVIKNRDEVVRAYMEERAKKQAKDSFSRYDFVSFDNDKLIYKLTDIEGKVRQITLEFNELYQQIAMTSNKSVGALDPIVSKIEQYKQSLERAKQSGYLNDVDFAGFNKAQEEVERLARAVEHGTAEYNDLAEARANALKEAEDLSKIARKNERQSNGTNQVNAAKRQYTNIQGTYSKEDIFGNQQFKFGDSPIFIEYKKAYDELIEKFESYKGKLKDPTIQEELAQEAAKVKTLGREFNKSATEAQNLEQLVEQSKDLSIIDSSGKLLEMSGVQELTDTNSLRQQMENYAQSLGHANMENVKFNATKQQMTYTMRINKDEVADMVVQYNKATNSLYLYNKQQRESLTGFKLFAAELKKKMGQILQYTASITSLYRVFNTLRQGITYVKEIDAALTELKKVTDETEKTYDNFLNTAAKTASKVGSTIKEVVSSTADFARLGYSLEDAAKMAENAQLLMNVSEFTDISSATDTLISAVQAFSYTADETLHVVDILNKIGK